MKTLAIYRKSDAQILFCAKVTNDEDAKFYPQNPDVEGVVEIPHDSPAYRSQREYKIANGELQQKNIVSLAASAQQFPADGTSSVDLTFTGLSASASVAVGGQQATVSPADPTITLTCDLPRSFTVQLVDADQWSNPVTVEAV